MTVSLLLFGYHLPRYQMPETDMTHPQLTLIYLSSVKIFGVLVVPMVVWLLEWASNYYYYHYYCSTLALRQA